MLNVKDLENKIINADCMDILKQLPDKCIDLVLTDPPYELETCVRDNGSTFNNLGVAEQSKVISMPYPVGDRIHPTQKPVELIQKLLRIKSNEGDLVLDCFSGSGTTAIACHKMKRRFICIEKDKQFYDASVKRLEQEQSQLDLF